MANQGPQWDDADRAGPPGSGPPPAPLSYARRLPRHQPTPPDVTRRRLIGTFRQLALASGLSLIALGLGQSIRQQPEGPGTMAMGGFVTGLAVTLRRGDRIW